jgi:hemoglobin
MRHVPYRIGIAERDAWLGHMRDALDEVGLVGEYDAALWDYLVRAADSLVNDVGPDAGPPSASLPIVS